MTWLLGAFGVGLPVALVFAWLFDLNREGIEPAAKASGRPLLGSRLEIPLVAALVLCIAVLAYFQISSSADQGARIASDAVADRASALPTDVPGTTSIAVLPFVTLSRLEDDRYFADGLTEELLNVLSRVSTLRVAARTSSFAYKGVNKNVQEIGRELNVTSILEGSVRRSDVTDTIRVTAQLIDVSTGTHLWSATFDREFRDVFRIQDEISAAVVAELKGVLGTEEAEKMRTTGGTDNPQALVAYSMGQAELSRRGTESLVDAGKFFRRAVEIDPEFANAYSGLADAHALRFARNQSREHVLRAQEYVDKAIAIDANSGRAWASQGLLHMLDRKGDLAVAAFDRSIALNPSYPMAYVWKAGLVADHQERQSLLTTAYELDPKSPVIGHNLAQNLLTLGRESEAMLVFSQMVEADPFYPPAYELIGGITEFRGRLDEAIQHYSYAYELEAASGIAMKLASLFVDLGDFEKADLWFGRINDDLPRHLRLKVQWLQLGGYVARGERERAEALLVPMLDAGVANRPAYVNAALAAYHLGNLEGVVTFYDKARGLRDAGGPLRGRLDHNWASVEVRLAAAYAYKELGRHDDAEALLTEIEDALARELVGVRVKPDVWYLRARLSAISDEPQMALVHLQRAVDEGWRQHWRPTVEPSLSSLWEDGDFRAMMAGLQTRMDVMRRQIDAEEEFFAVF